MGKKKVLSEGDLREMVMPGEGQMLGFVTQMLGYDRLMVKCGDGHERVCRIRGKMKRRVWIKVGDVVLVAPWDFQADSRGNICGGIPRAKLTCFEAKDALQRNPRCAVF